MSDQATGGVVAVVRRDPSRLARILATTIVGMLTAAVVTKLFGKKAGFLALMVSAAGHELFDAPLARRLSDLGL